MKRGFRLINVTKTTLLAMNLCVAESLWERMRGLLGRTEFVPHEGLLIPQCRSVHMWGMRFPIDVVFVDQQFCVRWLCDGLAPGHVSPVIWKARTCIELPVGTLSTSHTHIGDQLRVEPDPYLSRPVVS